MIAPAWPVGVDPSAAFELPKLTMLSAEAAATQTQLASESKSKRVKCLMYTVLVLRVRYLWNQSWWPDFNIQIRTTHPANRPDR